MRTRQDMPKQTKLINLINVSPQVEHCDPSALYICDGSEEEATELKELLINNGNLTKLQKMDNW